MTLRPERRRIAVRPSRRIVVQPADGADREWEQYGKPHFLTRESYERFQHQRPKTQ